MTHQGATGGDPGSSDACVRKQDIIESEAHIPQWRIADDAEPGWRRDHPHLRVETRDFDELGAGAMTTSRMAQSKSHSSHGHDHDHHGSSLSSTGPAKCSCGNPVAPPPPPKKAHSHHHHHHHHTSSLPSPSSKGISSATALRRQRELREFAIVRRLVWLLDALAPDDPTLNATTPPLNTLVCHTRTHTRLTSYSLRSSGCASTRTRHVSTPHASRL